MPAWDAHSNNNKAVFSEGEPCLYFPNQIAVPIVGSSFKVSLILYVLMF